MSGIKNKILINFLKDYWRILLLIAVSVHFSSFTGCGEKEGEGDDGFIELPEENVEGETESDEEHFDGEIQEQDNLDGEVSDNETGDGSENPSILDCQLGRRTFWAWVLNRMPPGDIQIEAECRGWGNHIAVFAADDVWESAINSSMVETIVNAFEFQTPAQQDKGIYQIVTSVFGEPPDVDGDPRIYLLYYSMGTYSGYGFDGFFRSKDEGSCSTCNHAEILFLDPTHNDPSGDYMLSIIPHEFQHMIHYVNDPDEENWINEAMSESAMVLCGYYTDVLAVNGFANNPDVSLVELVHVDYGAVFLFGLYMIERLGVDFLTSLVEETANGIDGFNNVASAVGTDFDSFLSKWFIANFIDDTVFEGGIYGYSTYDMPQPRAIFQETNGVSISETVNGTAAKYILYFVTGPSTLSFNLTSPDWSHLKASILTFRQGGADGDVSLIPVDVSGSDVVTEIEVPPTHDRVVAVIFSTIPSVSPYNFSCSAQIH